MSPRILVVDDEPAVADLLAYNLRKAHYDVLVAADGRRALELARQSAPDLIILDLMLPEVDGLEVCRELRWTSQVPVIVRTARGEEVDRVVGLEVGADDYVCKPFSVRELMARVKAVLRRAATASPEAATSSETERLRVGDVSIDLEAHEVEVRDASVKLPLKEFELLTVLARNPHRVLTRDTLIDRVWGAGYVGDTKTLDVHIKRLRAKIEEDPAEPTRIVTVRGVGYKYVPTG